MAGSHVLVMEEHTGDMVEGPSAMPVGERTHRLHRFAAELHGLLDQLTAAGVHPFGLGVVEVAETIQELVTAADRLTGLAGVLTRHADPLDVAAAAPEGAATSTRAWLNATARVTPGHAARMVRLGTRLATAYEDTATALNAGHVNPEQADVIVTALDRLPGWVHGDDRLRGEQHLLELARCYDARATMLVLRDDGNGTCHGRFRIPTLHGAMLSKYLDALANPRRPDQRDPVGEPASRPAGELVGEPAVDQRTRRPRVQVLGEALCELLERFPAKRLPISGGVNATVVVTIPLHTLTTGLGTATLDTGHPLTVGATRRLACQAGMIPAVLGTKSEVLDAGRRGRLHSPIQRTMLAVRDKGCTATGCDRPAAWCQAHHDIPFSQGGPTDLEHGRLLCARHHTLIHTPGYQDTRTEDNKVRITKVRRT